MRRRAFKHVSRKSQVARLLAANEWILSTVHFGSQLPVQQAPHGWFDE